MERSRLPVLTLSAGAILAVAIGILSLAVSLKDDPARMKAEFQQRLDQLDRCSERDPIRKDLMAEELLAEDSYKEHVKPLYLRLERAHPKLHESAQRERAAQRDLPPFLGRCSALQSMTAAELGLLHDEARALLDRYGGTGHEAALREALQRISERIDGATRVAASDVIRLQRDVRQAAAGGRFSSAMDLTATFLKQPAGQEYAVQVRELEESVRKMAAAAARALMENGRVLLDRGDKAGALQLIDRALPEFKGLREAVPLEALRRSIRLP